MAKRRKRRRDSNVPWVSPPGTPEYSKSFNVKSLSADAARMAGAARRLFEARTWEQFESPAPVFGVAIDRKRSEIYYVSFLNETAPHPGVLLHRGAEGLHWTKETAARTASGFDRPVRLGYAVTFGDSTRLHQLTRDTYFIGGLDFRGRGVWPLAEEHVPHYLPWPVRPSSLPDIAMVLHGTLAASGLLAEPWDQIGMPLLVPEGEGDALLLASAWSVQRHDPVAWTPPSGAMGFNQLHAHRLRALPQDPAAVWAIGAIYTPLTTFDEWDRKYYLTLTGCVDAATGEPIAAVAHHHSEMRQQMTQVLLDACEKRGARPATIAVASDVGHDAVEPLCEVLEATLRDASAQTGLVRSLSVVSEQMARE
jgi:hypothetical protein